MSHTSPPRIALVGLAFGLAAALVGCGASAPGGTNATDSSPDRESPFDLSTANLDERPSIEPIPEAVEALEASGFEPVEDGALTVVTSAFSPPISFFAEDDTTVLLGADPDLSALIADGLGLEYRGENVAWADWPLGIESGKYDLILSNVTVTEERKDLFDFATYRDDTVSFAVAADSEIESIESAEDVSGLTIVVSSGTNQEKILLDWFEQNEEAGLPPGDPVYYDDAAAAGLALASNRVDAIFQPNPSNSFAAAVEGDRKVVGSVNGGYPENAQIGAATAKGNGLIEPVSIVIEHLIESGEYDAVFERWALTDEAIGETRINPPGLPRP